ncbi:MAG: hypothetical protein IRZ07_29495 [Microbispora sp.]|nr:hypothetical protein [Microbispora sp.]
MPDLSARRWSARRRIAARSAAGAAVALALMTWPVLAASEPVTVLYSCTPADGAPGTYPVSVALAGPGAAVVSSDAVVTWRIAPGTPSEGQSALVAPATGIAAGDVVIAEGTMEVTGAPVVSESADASPSPGPSDSPTPSPAVSPSASPAASPSPSASPSPAPSPSPDDQDDTEDTSDPNDTEDTGPEAVADTSASPDAALLADDPATGTENESPPAITLTPTAELTVATAVSGSATLSPLPELVVTLTPTAEGTVAVAAGNFTLRLRPAGDTTGTGGELYTCTLPDPASRASLAFTVSTSAPPDDGGDDTGTSPSPGETTTATATVTTTVSATTTTTTTATATVTTTASAKTTVTATVTRTAAKQIKTTPLGGAQTGAGGDAGPDGRLVVLTGVALMAAAAAGGLLLRRFGPNPGPYGRH